jgi:hypothetical protein
MAMVFAVLASLVFIGWLFNRAVRHGQVKAHDIAYSIATVAGDYACAFFLSMSLPPPVKMVTSITAGIGCIFLAAHIQRKRQAGQT